MRRHWTVFAGLILSLALVAAACGDDDAESSSTTEAPTTTAATTTTTTEAPTTTAATTTTTEAPVPPLVIWADETRAAALEPLAEVFEAATGVPVEVELKGFGDIRTDAGLQASLGEAADIFVGAHIWVGELAADGVLEPIDLGVRADEWIPVSLRAWSYQGRLYGVPYATDGIAMIYNTDFIPEAPATFEDLTAACDAIAGLVETCIGHADIDDIFHHYPFVASTGGYVFAYDDATGYDPTDVGLDSDAAAESLTVLDTLVKDGYFDPAVDYDIMEDLFHSGRSAVMLTGPWALSGVREAGVPYAVAPLPQIAGRDAAVFVGSEAFMVNAFSEQKALALTFVLDFIATPEVMAELQNLDPDIPAYLPAAELFADDADLQNYIGAIQAGNPIPNIPEAAAMWENLGSVFAEIYNQTGTPEEALSTAAEAIRAAVAEG
jgi:maltose-binding protein MalE